MDDVRTAYSLPKGDETILVTADDEALRTLLRISLERCGYTVLEAAGGAPALRLAELHGELIALLVSDLEMPRMGGLRLAERMAAAGLGVKLLLLSGRDCDPALFDAGVAFLRKPFRPSALAAKVRQLLDSASDPLDARPVPRPFRLLAAKR
jgi:DNA-binding response OmpR family regulator